MPLNPRVSFQDGSFRLVVDDIFQSGGPRLRVHTSNGQSGFDRLPAPEYSYYLRNRTTREAVAGAVQRQILSGPGYGRRITPFGFLGVANGFRPESAMIRFPSTSSARLPSTASSGGQEERADEAWLKDAELVVVRTVAAGSVRRSLVMTGIKVDTRRQ